jgi:type I restriction enzyme, S subunit
VNKGVVHVPLESEKWPRTREWIRLDDLCEGIFDCPHSTPRLTEVGPLLVRSQDIRSGAFRWEGAAHVSEETYAERVARAEPSFGDILYSREGTYFGIAAEMPKDQRACLGQRMVLIRPDPEKVNYRFLRYWLNSPALSRHIHGFRDGSVAERLNMPTICGLPVPRFPRAEQDSIVAILGSLDDKIELNRRMNRSLEGMARAIFKAWFVDFEPTRAKTDGATSFRGMRRDVFEDLPSQLVPSEVGPIPVGWQVVSLSDVITLLGGGTPKRNVSEYWGGSIPWFSIRDAPSDGELWVIDTEETITEDGAANSAAKVMRAGTTIISARGTVGRLALTAVPMAVNQSCYGAQGVDGVGDYFVYYALHDAVANLQQHTHGSVFDTITRSTFDMLDLVRPDDNILKAFEETVAPLLQLIQKNRFESRTLGAIRDALLPKLISGEIRAPDVDWARDEDA